MEEERKEEKIPYQRKKIEGFENYEIDTEGNVYNLKTNKKVEAYIADHGYYKIHMVDNDGNLKNIPLHRVLALTFLKREPGKNYVNHKDGNKTNNSLSNLEWCSNRENLRHWAKKLRKKEDWELLPVYKYNAKTLLLDKIYKNFSEIREEYPPNKASYISHHIKKVPCGKYVRKDGSVYYSISKTAYGFVWSLRKLSPKEVSEEINRDYKKYNTIPQKRLYRKIYMYDPSNGKLLKIFSSEKEAKQFLGVKNRSIQHVLHGEQKTYLGYYFSFDNLSCEEVVEKTAYLSKSGNGEKRIDRFFSGEKNGRAKN